MVAISLCTVWYDPSFYPKEMIQAQMMRLGLAGNPDGSDKASITLWLFDKKLNLEGFEEMIHRRRPTVFASRHKLVMWWLCLSIPRMFPSGFWWDW